MISLVTHNKIQNDEKPCAAVMITSVNLQQVLLIQGLPWVFCDMQIILFQKWWQLVQRTKQLTNIKT